jgi:DNA-3-methyladenine glycosylase I
LSRRGFNLCAPTIIHAVMPAVEMVNDHVVTFPRHVPGRRMG